MQCDCFGDFLLRVRTIHADGDRWADHGGSALPFLWSAGPLRSPLLLSIHGASAEELRPAFGRAGTTIGASRACRTRANAHT